MIIQPNEISAHSCSTGTEVFTVLPGVSVRRNDEIHHAGRRYSVQRVQRVMTNGSTVVCANYAGKL
ncbi:hypothetical protein [Deinococcus peraridilitoris]|uniref:Uncharacterized protein n=1 Tax=Deinococcus peraridilitoris (strain DSM 19664 / LMG 22246 / CIP 109416 / KR-200) TaxID=937777 RepID=K9ZXI7_DEIPD|nr:hypothetical protein [Deinococcus peraridilitoris]AFZ66301.1 hypothetical protein Deipe_0722 [Deinococcus peraridilitoris DSM 19664]